MTTPAELIALALVDAGIYGQGQTASAEDTNNAFKRLNWMLAEWSRKRWLVYHLIDVSFTTTGAESYTVGTGGNFNTPRPDKIESAFARQLLPDGQNQIDYPLQIIQAREDYNRIRLKTLGSWPSLVFYDSGYPLGTLYVWPVPSSGQFSVHISLKAPLTAFATLAEDIEFPPEYEAAIFYNLVIRLQAAFKVQLDPMVVALAKDALNVLRGSNTQIPTLRMPSAILNRGRAYNVYSDGH